MNYPDGHWLKLYQGASLVSFVPHVIDLFFFLKKLYTFPFYDRAKSYMRTRQTAQETRQPGTVTKDSRD
jgi:hypothetical protein